MTPFLFGDEGSKDILKDFLKAALPELAVEEFKMLAEKNPMIRETYCKLQVMSENEANTIKKSSLK